MTSILRPNISFRVNRSKPVIVGPAEPTPYKVKSLSDIDDQANLRFYSEAVHFYHAKPSKATDDVDVDPAKVIKDALAKALVYYHPIAGRLREQPDGRLVVECTGEGAMFVEADADVPLEFLGDPITPPLTFIDRLLFDSELMSPGVVDQPLLYIQVLEQGKGSKIPESRYTTVKALKVLEQGKGSKIPESRYTTVKALKVTRFKCGGFSYAHRISHIIVDAQGSGQFLTAISELARGADQPSVLPVWERHLLLARDPPVATHIHQEYEPVMGATQEEYDAITKNPPADLVFRSFFFGPKEISALRRHVQPLESLSHVSRFEIITAVAWRSRTISLDYNPDYEVRVQFPVSARSKSVPRLPTGYYGNTFARAVALCKAGKLCSSPLEYAVRLVRAAKTTALSSDFLQSLADMTVLRGRPQFMVARTFMVSDLTRASFRDVDFGWGEGTFGVKPFPWVVTFYTSFKNSTGEEIVVVPMCLPEQAMARFMEEIEKLTKT